jgi:DNA adenine methylase
MSFFRYPGGKAKLLKPILKKMVEITPHSRHIYWYSEPFFGGGSVGLAVAEKKIFPYVVSMRFKDKDLALVCLWDAVIHNPKELIEKIEDYHPTVTDFYQFKEDLLHVNHLEYDPIDIAFKKLVIHQTSYSGLGVKAGGPIGGQEQTSAYPIDCRWSPRYMARKINKYHNLLQNKAVVEFRDFHYAFSQLDPIHEKHRFMYLDPPYYDKGNDLYMQGMTHAEHVSLARHLQKAQFTWLLSYDDCPEIRALYHWAQIDEVDVNYTIKTSRKRSELLIHRKSHD